MKNFLLYIPKHQNRGLSKHWLRKVNKAYVNFYSAIQKDDEYLKYREREKEKITHEDFVNIPIGSQTAQDIVPKYAELISRILDNFEVLGVWKKGIPDPNYPTDIVSFLRIYGYSKEVRICIKLIDYLLKGLQEVEFRESHDYRKLKMARKAKRKSIKHMPNAKARANSKILNKISELITNSPIFKPSSNIDTKTNRILLEVLKKENLDVKKYTQLKKVTLKSVRSRTGFITINRLA